MFKPLVRGVSVYYKGDDNMKKYEIDFYIKGEEIYDDDGNRIRVIHTATTCEFDNKRDAIKWFSKEATKNLTDKFVIKEIREITYKQFKTKNEGYKYNINKGVIKLLCINSVVAFKGNKNVVVGVETDVNGNVEKYILEDRFSGNRVKVSEEAFVPWNRVKHNIKKTFNSK